MMTIGALYEWIKEHRSAGMFDDHIVVAKDGELLLFSHPKATFGTKKIEWTATCKCPDFPPKSEEWDLFLHMDWDDGDTSFSVSISPSIEPDEDEQE